MIISSIKRSVNRIFHPANPIDWAFLIYLFIVTVIILLFPTHIPNWKTLLIQQSFLLIFALFTLRFCANNRYRFFRILHHWYPVFLFTYFYMTSGELNQVFFQGYWDEFFQKIDLWIFGQHPNLWLYSHLNHFYFNEIVHFCYFSYYILPVAFGIYVYTKHDGEFLRILFGISLCFYICYFLYIFLPVAGPIPLREGRFTDGGWFVQIMNYIYEVAEKPGAAFPSSHVAIALMVLLYARRYSHLIFWLIFPVIIGLFFSTVYCFYHYVIDVIAGLALGHGVYVLANRWFDKIYATRLFPPFH